MTPDTYNRIRAHIETIEHIAVHSNDPGGGYMIVNEMIKIQKEYNPNAMPVDTSCGNCVLSLFKDVYRNYKLNENSFS